MRPTMPCNSNKTAPISHVTMENDNTPIKAKSVKDAVVLHLADIRGQWVMSYELDHKTFYGKYTGMSGSRRGSDLARQGFHVINGVKYYFEGRPNGRCYEYRVTKGEKPITRFEEVEKDGEVFMRKIEETISV